MLDAAYPFPARGSKSRCRFASIDNPNHRRDTTDIHTPRELGDGLRGFQLCCGLPTRGSQEAVHRSPRHRRRMRFRAVWARDCARKVLNCRASRNAAPAPPACRAPGNEAAPADLGHFFAHANDALRPVEQRVWIPALVGDVDMLDTRRARSITGIRDSGQLVKPPFGSVDHCIGVRRSCARAARSSPMPISSP